MARTSPRECGIGHSRIHAPYDLPCEFIRRIMSNAMIEALDGRRRPLRIGHMGAGGLAPGNSMAGIEAALRIGVDLIELDVWRTLDDHLVLAHFPWVSQHPQADP
ncbi:MAG: glycerophosphodiester phosphodiesterase, partial [Chloroflexota bacterium]